MSPPTASRLRVLVTGVFGSAVMLGMSAFIAHPGFDAPYLNKMLCVGLGVSMGVLLMGATVERVFFGWERQSTLSEYGGDSSESR